MRERLLGALPRSYDGHVHVVSDYDDDGEPLVMIAEQLPEELMGAFREWLQAMATEWGNQVVLSDSIAAQSVYRIRQETVDILVDLLWA